MQSVLNQSYSNIEIIVVDDASTDGSKQILREISHQHGLPFFDIDKNIGNCAAFNKAWSSAKGKYIIDFATDDIMHPNRVEKQVHFFESLPADYGVIYSNAIYIDVQGHQLYKHFGDKEALMSFHRRYEGDIYATVLRKFFIPPPTMMFKNEVLQELGGYDPSLAYEDFDFWIRSSRKYKYGYQEDFLTKIRKSRGSHSTKLYSPGDQQLMTTYKVCLKAAALNQTEEEKNALIGRLSYEFKHAVLSENYKEADLFFSLIRRQGGVDASTLFLKTIRNLKLPLARLRKAYLKLRYGGNSGIRG